MAEETADGFLCHGFTTAAYLAAWVIPSLQRGLDRAGRPRTAVEVTAPGLVVTGRDEGEMPRSAAGVRRRLAFYGSTPAYRPGLEHHGWGELQTELHQMARRGQWSHVSALIEPEILEEFAVIGPPKAIAKLVTERFGNAVDRINAYSPFEADDHLWTQERQGFALLTTGASSR